jgi:hypothetical protein
MDDHVHLEEMIKCMDCGKMSNSIDTLVYTCKKRPHDNCPVFHMCYSFLYEYTTRESCDDFVEDMKRRDK